MSEVWGQLLEVARWTPSPHNTQPWKLRVVDGTTAELLIETARTLPDEDLTGCFIRCAMGMFVESVAIAASHLGFRLVVGEPGGGGAGLVAFCTLRLERGGVADELTPGDIVGRKTSRLPPRAEAVGEAELAGVRAEAARHGMRFETTADGDVIDAVMGANMRAVCHDLNDARYHDEIVRWFRYGRGHAARSNDGLDSSCMNMPAHELYLTAKLPWLLTAPLAGPLMRAVYGRRLGRVPQLGVIAGAFFEPAGAAPEAGRGLMRVWLMLHRLGVTIHPFGNLVTNGAAHAEVTRLLGVQGVWLVFRMGRTAEPPRSLRLSAEELRSRA